MPRSRLFHTFLVPLLCLLLSGCGFNNIPTYEELAKAKWSDVLNQYQRRSDLIPNLVETVKGFAKQESSVLEAVTAARAAATAVKVDASTITDPEAFKIGVLVAGTAGLVMGLGAALMEAVRRPDPRLVKPFLIASSALAGVGAIAGGMSLIEGGVYGPSKVGFGIGTMTLGTVALFIDSLALLEATPERTQPVKVAVIPFLGGLSLLGTF